MKRIILKVSLMVLNFIFLASCGIKKDPKPLPEPKYKVLRIGYYVFVIPKTSGITVEGFKKANGFFVKEAKGRFCFKVKHREGKVRMSCVEEAPPVKPSYKVELFDDRLVAVLDKPGTYKVYEFREFPIPTSAKVFEGRKIKLKRSFKPQKVAITKVLSEGESQPVVLEIPPKAPPKPPKPEEGRYVVKKDRIYLYWWLDSEDVVGFVVYRDGIKLTPKPIVGNIFSEKAPMQKVIYRVHSVNRFGVESDPLIIRYRP